MEFFIELYPNNCKLFGGYRDTNMGDFVIPFVRRDSQVEELIKTLNTNTSKCKSKSIIIRGESGAGKTSLLRHALKEYLINDEYIVIYINLNSDILTCSLFFEVLLFTIWNPVEPNENAMLSIPKKQSFHSYITKNIWHRRFAKYLYQIITNSISIIPTYGAIVTKALDSKALDVKYTDTTIDRVDYLHKYLRYICNSKNVILAIDNYQFIPNSIKVLFETCLQGIENNLNFITIYREYKENIVLPICFTNNRLEIKVTKFDFEDIYFLLNQMYKGNNLPIKEISQDCFAKTSGNLKEIELYIKENDHSFSNGLLVNFKSRSLKQIITQMPEIQRYLILLSAMFPAGLKVEYVTKILNKILVLNNQNLLNEEMKSLITLGYIVINSLNNNLMKPSHEKISISLAEIQNEEEFLEFYNSIKHSLETLIETNVLQNDYVYMLHCIVGLYNTNQLMNRMNYLIDLIRIEYDQCSYYYIASIYKQIQDITPNLPEVCLNRILDSCQKTSEFSLGLSLIERLKYSNQSMYQKYRLYEIKYLTQSYDFGTALNEIQTMEETNEILLYKLNILQHIGRNDEASNYIFKVIENNNYDKWFYLMLRNSSHYFTYEDASSYLNKCFDYFSRNGTKFEQATVLNNLGVINVWHKNFFLAKKYLSQAEKLHKLINSNEIFEVYCNLGVMEFLKGNIKASLEYNNMAMRSVPQSLTLDHIILKMNNIIYGCAKGDITLKDALNEFLTLYNNYLINKDPWVRFQIVYNLIGFEHALNLMKTEEPDEYYLNKNKENSLTCFEVFYNITVDKHVIPVSLSLSPNWRY